MLHRENRILANLWNIFVLITSKNHACYLPHVFPIEYPHHHQMNTLLNAMIPYLLLINFNLYLWKYFWVKPIHYYNLRLHHWNCTNSWRNRWYIKTRMFWVAGDTIAMTGIFFNESKKKMFQLTQGMGTGKHPTSLFVVLHSTCVELNQELENHRSHWGCPQVAARRRIEKCRLQGSTKVTLKEHADLQ